MKLPIVTVVNKMVLAPSGDARDYVSLSIYWWPNPITGLPYIPHDGRRNPEAETYDAPKLRQMIKTVRILAAANVAAQDQRALEWLRAWFISPATRMNPHLTFAQMMPGIAAGGRQGIIEGLPLATDMLDSLAWLDARQAIPEDVRQELHRWLSEYLAWLIQSDAGRAEAARKNNHSTWHSVQIAALATSLGRTDLVRETLHSAASRSAQFDQHGAQPEELRRSKAFAYSLYNLDAWAHLERLGQKHGVTLWQNGPAHGLAYLQEHQSHWPHRDLERPDIGGLSALAARLKRWKIADTRQQ